MYFDYFDMLSGDPVLFHGVGYVQSPKLRDLSPYRGVGYRSYNFYLNFLLWDKEKVLKYDRIMKYRGVEKIDREDLDAYDVITLLRPTRELCRDVLSFFVVGHIEWAEKDRKFIVRDCSAEHVDDPPSIVGEINKDNFEALRSAILQLNFIGLEKNSAPVKHSDEKTKELWDQVQNHLKAQNESNLSRGKPEYNLDNIISKLCAAHPSYNMLNVFQLTIFQLYDAFFQLGYIRSADLNERIFSNHGGDKFKFEDWLKPVIQNT